MAAVGFASKYAEDGTIAIPKEVADELGLVPGDDVYARVDACDRAATGAAQPDEPDQDELQERFDRFFERLAATKFEAPPSVPIRNPVKAGFAEVMDEKFRKLGFSS